MKKLLFLIIMLFTLTITAQNASYYGDKFHGRKTASGIMFDKNKLTAAHKTLPFGTLVKVTNTKNNKFVIVRIIDRGPLGKKRIIDLSKAAFKEIANPQRGVITVIIEVIQ